MAGRMGAGKWEKGEGGSEVGEVERGVEEREGRE